jgi:hypothetical protein
MKPPAGSAAKAVQWYTANSIMTVHRGPEESHVAPFLGEKCYTQTHSPHINGIAYRDCTG